MAAKEATNVRRMMVILLMLLIVPALAGAVPDTPYAPETAPRYTLLTEAQQALLDTFHAAATAGQTRIDLPAGTRYDDAAAALELLTLDYPELAGLERQYVIGYYRHAPQEATYAELRYAASLPEMTAMRRGLVIAAEEMARGAQGGSDFRREMDLHDALCARVTYDPAAPHPHDAYGALYEGRATCEGYAQAMTLLLRMSGIPCTAVTGLAWNGQVMGPHAWNYVYVGGAWGHLDATYDDQQETTLHWYFNLSDGQMGQDHQWDYLPPLGGRADPAEYHLIMGTLAATAAEAEAILARDWQAGSVSLRFADRAAYEAFTADVEGALRRIGADSCRIMKNDQQLCVLVSVP